MSRLQGLGGPQPYVVTLGGAVPDEQAFRMTEWPSVM
jgi:hypothetical protein